MWVGLLAGLAGCGTFQAAPVAAPVPEAIAPLVLQLCWMARAEPGQNAGCSLTPIPGAVFVVQTLPEETAFRVPVALSEGAAFAMQEWITRLIREYCAGRSALQALAGAPDDIAPICQKDELQDAHDRSP